MAKPQPLSVIMLIDAWFPFVGGGQIHVRELSKHLSAQFNCQIKIFHPRNSSLLYRLLWTFISVPQIVWFALTHQVDLIHSHAYLPGLTGKISSLILHTPLIHTVHGSNYLDQKSPSLMLYLEKFLLTQIKYSGQITVSRNFLQYPNVNPHPIYIPNGVDICAFEAQKVKKYSRTTVLFVGRNQPVKGIDILKQAQKIVQQSMPQVKFKYIVSGRYPHHQLITVYKKSHLFVLPSRSEGQPITLLEAWAAQLPCIATKVGDIPFLIQNGHTGIIITPNNPELLAHTLIQVINDSKLLRRLGRSGFNYVKKHHTWTTIASQTHRYYQQTLTNFT